MKNDDKDSPTQDFEAQLKGLTPISSSETLKARLEQSLGSSNVADSPKSQTNPASSNQPPQRWILGIAAAIGGLAMISWFLIGQPFSKNPTASGIASVGDSTSPPILRTVGQQQVVLSASKPDLVEFPDRDPMWEIQLQILNRALVETPSGVERTIYVPEERTVFVPAVYR